MNQFNVYDIFGYLLPGALVVIVSLVAFSQYVSISLQPTLGESAILVVVCYIVGHFVRASVADRIKGLKPSAEILAPDDRTFPDEIKTRIIESLAGVFSVSQTSHPDLAKEQQYYFDLAYALIVQKNAAGYTPIYNSLYALYRGLLAASGLSSMIVIGSLFVLLRSANLTPERLVLHLVSFGILAYLTWGLPFIVPSPLRKQFDRYARLFAASVYRNFLVWYQTCEAADDARTSKGSSSL